MQELLDIINDPQVTVGSSIFKLILSMIVGSAIGYERKRKGQIAGVRTFSLICMGATLAMLLSIYVPQVYLGLKNGDPSRIAAQVVSGIGFLGAGAIIQMKGAVRGLTTAAGIWMVAAIGMAIGVGMYTIAIIATVLVLFVLLQLEKIEHSISLGSESRTITICTSVIITDLKPYTDVLKQHHVHVINCYIACDYTAQTSKVNIVVVIPESVDFITLMESLRPLYPTNTISLSNQVSI